MATTTPAPPSSRPTAPLPAAAVAAVARLEAALAPAPALRTETLPVDSPVKVVAS